MLVVYGKYPCGSDYIEHSGFALVSYVNGSTCVFPVDHVPLTSNYNVEEITKLIRKSPKREVI